MKRLFSIILATVVVALAIWSCKDDFNEQDFLKLQSELKLKQDSIKRARNQASSDSSTKEAVASYIAAQNEAGSLMGLTVIVREDNTPVPGVAVTINAGTAKPGGRTQAVTTATTDALGVAVFDAAIIANSTITLSKTGYVGASTLADFGSPGAPIAIVVPNAETGGTKTIYVSPQKKFENVSLPLFSESATAGNTAVISGVYSIDNDLTNDPNVRDAIPAGQVITANLGSALATAGILNSSCGCVGDYRFTGAAGSLGVANIDATTGVFSMRVPATAAGLSINLILPTISGTQKVAVRRLNTQDIAPEYRNVPTIWQPGNNPAAAANNAIPNIPGAMAVFNGGTPPPSPGRGWGATFAVIARAFEPSQTDISANGNSSPGTNGLNTYNLSVRGRGYSSSPAVAINGGGSSATGATATSSLRGYFTSANISAGGTGYAASTAFDLDFFYTDAVGTQVFLGQISNVTSNASGVLPVGNVTLPNATTGFATTGSAMFTTDFAIQGFGVRVSVAGAGLQTQAAATTQATVTFTTDTEVDKVRITNGGTGYTTAPTFVFSGGGSPTSNAAVTVVAFRSQYTITLSSTPATTPYKLLPAGIAFTYTTNGVDDQLIQSPAKVDRLSTNLSTVATNADFIGQLVTDGTNLSALNPLYTYRTTTFWTSAPAISVIDQLSAKATANLSIAATGEINSISDPDVDAPTINELFPTTIDGDGYDAFSVAIMPTITGAPGAGAVFLPTISVNSSTREVTWDGSSARVSGGAGYLTNLNRSNAHVAYPSLSPITVQTGKIYPLIINAGTGIRSENVTN